MSGFTAPSVTVDAMTVAATGQDPHDRLADLLSGPSVTILGSRAATSYGQQVASDLGARLAHAGVTVVTVLTSGISNAAARGALAAGGRVLLVVPAGMRAPRAIPSQDAAFADSVQRDGALVSFLPDEQVTTRTSFRDAHRIATAIGGALVIPEASAKSVAVEYASHAAGASRLVYAVPGPVTSTLSEGPHELIRSGQAKLITEAGHLPVTDLFSYPPVVRTR